MSTYSRFTSLLLFCSSLFYISLAGCGDNPVSPTIAPKIGSSYTVAGYNTDASGAVVESTRDTIDYTLTEIHTNFRGESNVYEYSSKYGSSFIAFHDDGDISLLFITSAGSSIDSVWLKLPTTTKKSVSTILYEDVQVVGSARVENRMTYTAEHDGSTSITVNGKSLGVEKIKGGIENKISYVIAGQPASDQVVNTNIVLWFAPGIGYLAHQESSITQGGASVGPGSFGELIDYELK
ncbi:MAG: hypothetical protein KDD67_18295 [Ignavibacteriae bacterium]|nr:hypothetical protein [Ignavibacteriota bacterium]MCB9214534.1 hypothetical protein [Ignavibacteria bacterium]